MIDKKKISDNYFMLQAKNNHWSNKRLLQACKKLNAKEYFAKRKAFFGSIHATLVHIAHTDKI